MTLVTHLLQYHVLQGTLAAGAVQAGPPRYAATLLRDRDWTNVTAGQNAVVYKQSDDTVVFASGGGSRSTLLEADMRFSGGLVQMVDTLLVPPPRLEQTARDAYPRDLTAFLGALYAAGLDRAFANTPDVTIFAPRNAAFQRVAGVLTALSRDELARVLAYHLVPAGVLPSPSLANDTNLATAANVSSGGAPLLLHVTRAGNNLFVDSAQVVQPDILVANGVLHIIDNVLSPDGAALRPDPDLATQPPVFPPTGATEAGNRAPTPFTSALPCTANCPVATAAAAASVTRGATTTTGTVRASSSAGAAAAPPPAMRPAGLLAREMLLGGVVLAMGVL